MKSMLKRALFKQWRLQFTKVFISLLLFGLIWPTMTIHAQPVLVTHSESQSQPAQPVSSSAVVWFWWLVLRDGFNQQPTDVRSLADKKVTLSTSFATGNSKIIPHYTWWKSVDDGHQFSRINNSDTKSYSFRPEYHANRPTIKFQVQCNTGNHTYWSRVATVTVTQKKVPAKAIHVKAEEPLLANGGTTKMTATLTPENATDQVRWESDNPALATVDETGLVTACAANTDLARPKKDHGLVHIKGSVNGHSAVAEIKVGILQDVQVNEGDAATFSLANLPADVHVQAWHRVTRQKSNASIANKSYTFFPTHLDNDSSFFATLSYTDKEGQLKTSNTNAAQLKVTKTNALHLATVPNFDFGSISLAQLSASQPAPNLLRHPAPMTDRSDHHQLVVINHQTKQRPWQLSAKMTPFEMQTAQRTEKLTGDLFLNSEKDHFHQTLTTNGQVTQMTNPNDPSADLSVHLCDSQLTLTRNPRASIGSYHSTITWILTAAP